MWDVRASARRTERELAPCPCRRLCHTEHMPRPNKPAYAAPRSIPAGMSMAAHITPLVQFQSWLHELGITTGSTRISRYIKYLKALYSQLEGSIDRVFIDPQEHPFRTPEDRFLYVMREVHELIWIYNGLKIKPPHGIERKLRKIVGGSDFAALDRNTESRDTQFELRIASYFCRLKYYVDVSTDTDIVARSLGMSFHVECKRVSSERMLQRRLKEAAQQLNVRRVRGPQNFGIVALDVTKVAYTHNGLTSGVTQEHSRDVIRSNISRITDDMRGISDVFADAANILVWSQIHIPSLVNQPLNVFTHLTSRLQANPTLTSSGRKALRRFERVLRASELDRSADVEARTLKAREWVKFEEGTELAPDQLAVGLFVLNGTLPHRAPDHVVMTITNPSGHEEEFLFAELVALIDQLGPDQVSELRRSVQAATTGLGALLVHQRYPLEDGDGTPQLSIPPALLADV